MASEEIITTEEQEQYLYLYTYEIEGKHYTYCDYFKNQQQAKTTILFYNAEAPYIKTISLEECPYGVRWRGLLIPYKKSDWQKMHHMTN